MRIKIIACEVLYRELCLSAAESPHIVDLEFLSQGLHDLGAEKMSARIQERINEVNEERYDAVVLGFALCNNGVIGLTAGKLPLVIPRAHDCVTLFLGSKERYDEVFNRNPGTYFMTTGWFERDKETLEKHEENVISNMGLGKTYEQYVEEFGEENAKYLMETLGDGLHNYSQFTFIKMGVGPEDTIEAETRKNAERRGWAFETIEGNLRLFRMMCNSDWQEADFLTVEPGHKVEADYKGCIINACRCAIRSESSNAPST